MGSMDELQGGPRTPLNLQPQNTGAYGNFLGQQITLHSSRITNPQMPDKYCCKVTLTCRRRSFHGGCSKWYHYSPNQPGSESKLFSLSSFSLSSAVLSNLLPSSFPVLFLPATAQTPATYDHSNPGLSTPRFSLFNSHYTLLPD